MGRRTLLYQASAKEKLSQLLGGPRVGEQLVEVRENLWAVNTNPGAALHEYGLMILRYETIYRMVFENRVTKSLLRAIPGLDDYSIIGKMWWHATQEEEDGSLRWDTVVFDAPATGHALTMFKIPSAILEAVPDGPLTRDAVRVRRLLEDPDQTSVVLVTLAEEMPTNEAIELHDRLHTDLHMHPACLVVNQLYPDRFTAHTGPARVLSALLSGGEEVARDSVLSQVLPAARTIYLRRELNERYLARAREKIKLPEVHVPLLLVPSLGNEEVDAIARIIEEQTVPMARRMA